MGKPWEAGEKALIAGGADYEKVRIAGQTHQSSHVRHLQRLGAEHFAQKQIKEPRRPEKRSRLRATKAGLLGEQALPTAAFVPFVSFTILRAVLWAKLDRLVLTKQINTVINGKGGGGSKLFAVNVVQ